MVGRTLAIAALVAAMAVPGVADADPAARPAGETPAPRAQVGERTRQLGVARRAQRIEVRFAVGNEGDAPLTFGDGWALGCSRCVRIPAPPSLAPGAKGEVVAVIDTTDLGGRTSLRLLVPTNDPEKKVLGFEVELDVEMMVTATPGYIRFIYVHGEPTGTITQTIGAKDRDDFQVLDVTSPYPFVSVSWREATAEERLPQWPGRQWRVAATIAPDAAIGPLAGTVDVRTNHDTDTMVRIPVSGFVRPRWAVTPEALDVGEVALASSGNRFTAYYTAFNTAGLPLTAARSSVPGILVELKPVQAPHRYEILITLPPTMAPGAFDGKLLLDTADAALPRIEVPLRGRIVTGGGNVPSPSSR
jgi:hypothetical protein